MENQPTSNAISRSEFLRSLGLSSAALMSIYCLGTLTACSGSKDDPAPTNPGTSTGLTGNADTSQGAINFSLDLTATTYATLKTEGNAVVVGSLIVARAKGNKLVALSKACTHQGTTVEYRLNEDDFYCTSHGSRFADDGTVKNGPATAALKLYTTALSADGNTLKVTT